LPVCVTSHPIPSTAGQLSARATFERELLVVPPERHRRRLFQRISGASYPQRHAQATEPGPTVRSGRMHGQTDQGRCHSYGRLGSARAYNRTQTMARGRDG
jgi:hypothetical protein